MAEVVAHLRRGRQVIDDIGVLGQTQGSLVHDRLASYWAYGSRHAVCCAHLLRDLAGIAGVPRAAPLDRSHGSGSARCQDGL
jgi:hypothetical protein